MRLSGRSVSAYARNSRCSYRNRAASDGVSYNYIAFSVLSSTYFFVTSNSRRLDLMSFLFTSVNFVGIGNGGSWGTEEIERLAMLYIYRGKQEMNGDQA